MNKTIAIFIALTVFTPVLSQASDKVSMEQLQQLKAVCEAVKNNPRLALDKEFYPSWQKPFKAVLPDFAAGKNQKETKISFSLKGGFNDKKQAPYTYSFLAITASQEKEKISANIFLNNRHPVKSFSDIKQAELHMGKVSGRLWALIALEKGNGSATHCDAGDKFGTAIWNIVKLAAQSLKAKTWR